MSGEECVHHPHLRAVAICCKCHSPICPSCVRRVCHGMGVSAVERMYCPKCYEVEVRKGSKWRTVAIVLFVMILFSLSPLILAGILLLLYFMGLPVEEFSPI